jgi:ATP-binding cassette subfamily G (WHITE) protein 2 (SNQ2)
VWRDYGIFWVYIFFNFAVVFVCSWLYLQGAGKIKKFFSPAARQQKKAAKQREQEGQNEKRN